MGPMTLLARHRAYLDANVFIYAVEAYPQFAAWLTDLFARIDVAEIKAVTSEMTLAELFGRSFPREQPCQGGELLCHHSESPWVSGVSGRQGCTHRSGPDSSRRYTETARRDPCRQRDSERVRCSADQRAATAGCNYHPGRTTLGCTDPVSTPDPLLALISQPDPFFNRAINLRNSGRRVCWCRSGSVGRCRSRTDRRRCRGRGPRRGSSDRRSYCSCRSYTG
jgi:hypothetical protein